MIDVGNKDDMVTLLEMYLTQAKRGAYSQIAICATEVGGQNYSRNALVEEGSSVTNVIGALERLLSDIHTFSDNQEEGHKAANDMLDMVDLSKPQ